jgi:hypothetical protein
LESEEEGIPAIQAVSAEFGGTRHRLLWRSAIFQVARAASRLRRRDAGAWGRLDGETFWADVARIKPEMPAWAAQMVTARAGN